jgi:hypothetical protein
VGYGRGHGGALASATATVGLTAGGHRRYLHDMLRAGMCASPAPSCKTTCYRCLRGIRSQKPELAVEYPA